MYPVTSAVIPETGDVFVQVIVGSPFVSKPAITERHAKVAAERLSVILSSPLVSSPHKVAGQLIVCESQFEVKRSPGAGNFTSSL
jgi:hypothetical protein